MKKISIFALILIILFSSTACTQGQSQYDKGYDDGYECGYDDGYYEGHQDGYGEGISIGEQNLRDNYILLPEAVDELIANGRQDAVDALLEIYTEAAVYGEK